MAPIDPLISSLRGPLTLALRLSELTLDAALGAVRLGRELLEPDEDLAPPVVSPIPDIGPEPVEEPEVEVPVRAPRRPPVEERPPPVQPEARIEDEQSEVVAEFAEPGAEEGAGAEVGVRAPWDGYDRMTAADIERRLSDVTVETLAAVQLYEGSHKKRRGVLQATDRRLRQARAGA